MGVAVRMAVLEAWRAICRTDGERASHEYIPPPYRRPPALALVNARFVDPSALIPKQSAACLITDGLIRDLGAKNTGQASPQCTDHRLPRRLRGAGPHRHAGLHRRARRRAPRDDRDCDPGGGGRRRHHDPLPAPIPIRPSTSRPSSIFCCAAPATPAACGCCLPAALTEGLKGAEIAEIGLLQQAGAVAFSDGARSICNARVLRRVMQYARDFDALVITREGSRSCRRRSDERRRIRRPPRSCGNSA